MTLFLAEGSLTTELSDDDLRHGLHAVFGRLGDRQKVLALPPDFTRFHSRAGLLTCQTHEFFGDRLTDVMPALGTHVPMPDWQLARMFPGLPKSLIRDHRWRDDVVTIGEVPADFVSSADHKAEETLVEDLRRARPNFGFLLEEGGEIKGEDSSNRWIIDPLDGTTNFLHGIPHFAISIGLERDAKMFAGVIYDPLRDELFWAETGSGAFLNSKRLRVSARDRMSDTLIATAMPFKGRASHPEYPDMLDQVWAASSGVRRFGSAALDLAYVAAGRYDGFWETGLMPWDIAAGVILVREAGGLVTDIAGRDLRLEAGSILTANRNLHQPLGDTLRNACK